MSRFTILLNGPVILTERLKKQAEGTRALAADGGMTHAAPLGLNVELWVGDFDSTSEALAAHYSDTPRQRFAMAKDKTDGELAADEAIRRGASSLLLIGSFGGQIDHTLGHLALAVKLARKGIPTILTSGEEEAYPLLPGKTRIGLPQGSRLSIIALADVEGLTLRGTHWALEEAAVELGSTSTISNIAIDPVEILLRSGYGIAIAYPGMAGAP
jgi:thiamine pyrophosphokinase